MTEARAVALVARQAVEAEKRQGLVAGAFARQEVTVMPPAMQIHQSNPFPGKAFERLDLPRVDGVVDDAGNHETRRLPRGVQRSLAQWIRSVAPALQSSETAPREAQAALRR